METVAVEIIISQIQKLIIICYMLLTLKIVISSLKYGCHYIIYYNNNKLF